MHPEVQYLPSPQHPYPPLLRRVLEVLEAQSNGDKQITFNGDDQQSNRSPASPSLLTWESLASWSALSAHLTRHTRCALSARGPLRAVFSRRPGTTRRGYHLHWHLYAGHVVGHSLCRRVAARSGTTIEARRQQVQSNRERNIHM